MVSRRAVVTASIAVPLTVFVSSARTPQVQADNPVSRLVHALADGNVDDLESYVHPEVSVPSDLVEGIDAFRFWVIGRNAGLQEDYTDIDADIVVSFSNDRWSMVYAQVAARGRSTDYQWVHDWQITAAMDQGLIRTVMAASIGY